MAWFFAGLSLTAAAVCLVAATVVLLRDQKNMLNRVFAVLCLSVAYWSFVQFQSRQAPDVATAAFWIKASAPWPLVEALLLHFVLIFTNRTKLLARKLTYVLIYAPALLIALVDLLTHWITGAPVKAYWGWTSIRPGTAMNLVGDGFIFLWTLLALYLCLHYLWEERGPRLRQRAYWVLGGISVPVFVGITTDVLLPRFFPVPELGPAAAAVGIAFCSGYAMWRYELFAVTPSLAAEKILSTMSDCLFLTDQEGKILTANGAAEKVVDDSPPNLDGRNIDQLLVGTSFNAILEIGDAKTPRHTGQTETAIQTKTNGQVPVSLAWSTMTAEDGSPIGVVWIARDITERRQIDRLKSDLIATVSHELRSPLAVIIGSAGMVERLYESGRHEACLSAIHRISVRSKAMGQLVDALLDMRRIELGDFSPQLEQVDVAALVRKETEEAVLSEAHCLSFRIDEAIPSVRCDAHRVRAAFSNLVRNAVKFSPEGGTIEVTVGGDRDLARISVRDEGVGIAPLDQERIFDRFVQADMSTRRAFDGAGIGLYLVKEIMKAHDGKVSVDSEPGKGSTFTLELPVRGPHSEHKGHRIAAPE